MTDQFGRGLNVLIQPGQNMSEAEALGMMADAGEHLSKAAQKKMKKKALEHKTMQEIQETFLNRYEKYKKDINEAVRVYFAEKTRVDKGIIKTPRPYVGDM